MTSFHFGRVTKSSPAVFSPVNSVVSKLKSPVFIAHEVSGLVLV
jgi:hypothetical protein